MNARHMIPILIAAAAACGGKGASDPATPAKAATSAEPDLDALYRACGLYTTKDMQEELGGKAEDELTDEDYEKLSRDPAMHTVFPAGRLTPPETGNPPGIG